MKDIFYKKKTYCNGRNGVMNTIGLSIYTETKVDEFNVPYDTIVFQPITKIGVSSTWMDVDINALDEIINELQCIKKNLKNFEKRS